MIQFPVAPRRAAPPDEQLGLFYPLVWLVVDGCRNRAGESRPGTVWES